MRPRSDHIRAVALLVAALLAPAATVAAPPKAAADKADGRTEETPSELGPLMHATATQAKARLGDPDVARAEGKGAIWTYRLPHCALFLFFHEGPKGLRVSGAATGPRKRGEPVLDLRTCLAGAVQLPPPDIGPEH